MFDIVIKCQNAVRKEQLMDKFRYQIRTETTQRLADARCGKLGYHLITKQPYIVSHSEASVQETLKVSPSSINDKPFDLEEFLRKTEGKSYEYVQSTVDMHYGNRKR